MQTPKIQVVIRKRPLNQKELNSRETDIISVHQGTVTIREQKMKLDLTRYIDEHIFQFDGALDEKATNFDLYQQYVRPVLSHAFNGNKGTVFAFGQTGSGKTFTMNGVPKKNICGMYQFSAHDIFESINNLGDPDTYVTCTFYQLYCGKIYDLLNDRNELKIQEDRKKDVHVSGGKKVALYCPEQMMKYIRSGMSLRVTSKNGTNAESSRSHAVLNIQIGSDKNYGEISFIDLAGCERGADTIQQDKQTKVDGAEINKSLLALKECIRAMDGNKKHIPFRGSKLTLMLRQSFGDNCKTLMIGNISPGSNSCENTLNTLRYSDTVKELKSTKQKLSRADLRSRQLMLTRNQKNTVTVIPMEQQENRRPSSNPKRPSVRASKRIQTEQNNLNFKNIQTNTAKRQSTYQTNQNLNHNTYSAAKNNTNTSQNSSIYGSMISNTNGGLNLNQFSNLNANPNINMSRQKNQFRMSQFKKNQDMNSNQPLSSLDYQDWGNSIQLLKQWDIYSQPYPPYQQLINSSKQYLQRELCEYFLLCQQSIELQDKISQQKVEALRDMYNNSNGSNQQIYKKCQMLSNINSEKNNIVLTQENKLKIYMSHLELQEEYDRKMAEAKRIQGLKKMKSDDQMSLIDQINSEWGDELNSFTAFDYPTVNRPNTRSSLNLQRDQMNFNVMKSYEFRPY